MGWQKSIHLFIKPLISLILVAGWTVPVSAAAGDMINGITVFTFIKKCSKGTASAITDIPDGFFMGSGHFITIKIHVLTAIGPEYLLYGAHDNTPCINWATLSLESSSARVVTWR
jgi:hypothetical protein